MRNLNSVEVNVVSGGLNVDPATGAAAYIALSVTTMVLGGYLAGETGVVLGFMATAGLAIYDIAM